MNRRELGMKASYLSIVYVSTATEPFTEKGLVELLTKSQANNQKLDITGMLLHEESNFMQVIEGPHDSVRALHEKILKDPRHTGIITLIEQELEVREFGEWSMAFRDIDSSTHKELKGYSRLLNRGELPQEFIDDPGRAKKLLLAFRNNLRTN